MFFKLNSGTDDRARRDLSRLAREAGASRVRRLFPRSTAGDLRLHFVADIADESAVPGLIAMLNGRPEVAFAQRGRPRRPLDDPE